MIHTAGVELLDRHKNPDAASHWAPLLAGRVSAAGAPSQERLQRWAQAGATDIVTLQRPDERPSWLPEACEAAGLTWHEVPLSGRRLAPEDTEALRRLPELLPRLEAGAAMVFHCAAGMHRTGLALYLVCRHAGLDPDDAHRRVSACRALTGHELGRNTRKSGRLRDLADQLFAEV